MPPEAAPLPVAEPEESNRAPGKGYTGALALEVHGLTKTYPATLALRALEFTLRPGEVRALLGKNGAGKSTFVEILSGTITPDSGEIIIGGEAVQLDSPVRSRMAGIATVHQEPTLFPELSVAENLTLGRAARHGIVSRQLQLGQARAALEVIGETIPLDERVGRLAIRDQQLIAIAKALSSDPHVLILDEPTSALSSDQVEHLLNLVKRLARQGVAVIYVSHRLDEIPRVADSVTVLRDGALVDTVLIADAPPARIVEMMLGRSQLREEVKSRHASSAPVVLAVEKAGDGRRLHDVSLEVRSGEVVGLWGMPGAGRSELMRGAFGLQPFSTGRLTVNGKFVRQPTPRSMIRRGVGFTPDDRKREGLVLGLSIGENLVMASPGKVSKRGVLRPARVQNLASSVVRQLAIKTRGLGLLASSLSGGNQQKVVVGKWLAAGARILLMDEPTKGVDIEAKAALYALLRELTAAGHSVLLAPTELEELFLACDRIVVLRRGRVVGELTTQDTTPATVMALAMGG
jgi:ABC-type sugar transport system ATPase subunit